jgi:hypothetical protein
MEGIMDDQALKVCIIVSGILIAIGLVAIAVITILIIKTRRERMEIEELDPSESDPVFDFAQYNKLHNISHIIKSISIFLSGILIILLMLIALTGCIYGLLSSPNSTFLAENEPNDEVVYRIYNLSAIIVVEDYEDLKDELNIIINDLRTNIFVLIVLSVLDYIAIRVLFSVSKKYDNRIKKNLRARLGDGAHAYV